MAQNKEFRSKRFNERKSEREPTMEDLEEAIKSLAEQGKIYDTGERRWSERTRSYQIVWAAVPPKDEQH